MALRSGVGRLQALSTQFYLCDMQEKFRAAITNFPYIVETSKRLVATSKILNIPLIVTEQNPKALGATVGELDISKALINVPKTQFSMLTPEVRSHLTPDIKSVVLFGIEAHVCVLQTALDLIDSGFDVHVVADAVSSRSLSDRQYALDRMRQSGAFITSTESVILQLVRDAAHPNFKELQGLIKQLPSADLAPGAPAKAFP